MKIYLLSQKVNNGYDTYSDCIVVADNKEQAKRIHPSDTWLDGGWYDEEKKEFWTHYANSKETYLFEESYGSWTNDLSKIRTECIGEAHKKYTKPEVIISSFHAG